MESVKETFFVKDRTFFKTLFRMLIFVALQNVIAYSVNMTDNIMLGSYSQEALSGAATANQIFFMVQQFASSIGNTLVALASQYWGKKQIGPIRTLTGISLKLSLIVAACIIFICGCFPELVLQIFTTSPEIIAEGKSYLMLAMWSFAPFIVTNVLMSVLRAVGTVRISFYVSIVSLIVNVSINYILIFGKFGFPEMGIRGAAVGTLIARALELLIILIYLIRADKKLHLIHKDIWQYNRELKHDYTKIYLPAMCAQVLWGVSVPMQTAILGHLSADAIAANSVSTTFYQYLKVVTIAMSTTSAALIGNTIGRGDMRQIKSEARTISVIDIVIGVILGLVLIALRKPLLSMYTLNDNTTTLAIQMILLFGIVMMFMAYQAPVSFGIMQGGGDTPFLMKMNMISTWCIVMPLSFMAAFWWKLPVLLVVLVIQSDQIFKCVPVFLHFRSYKWIKKLTREEAQKEQ